MKKTVPVIVMALALAVGVGIKTKGSDGEPEKFSVEIPIGVSYLEGQALPENEAAWGDVYVDKALLTSGSIAVYEKYDQPKYSDNLCIKDISIKIKGKGTIDLWKNCEDKTVSYDRDTKEGIVYILFSEPVEKEDIKYIEISGEKFYVED